MFERVLKFDLLVVTAMNRVGISNGDVALGLNARPKLAIIKLALVSIPRRVVNILYVDKNRYLFHPSPNCVKPPSLAITALVLASLASRSAAGGGAASSWLSSV